MKNLITGNKKVSFIIIFAALFFSLYGNNPQIHSMEFVNQPVTDILSALARAGDVSIIPDETVTGNATYYFSETDFLTALKLFLSTYRLHFWQDGTIFYISRVRTNFDDGLLNVHAEQVEIDIIIRSVSRAIGKTIQYDPLPRSKETINGQDITPEKFLEILMAKYPDFEILSDPDYFYIKRKPPEPVAATGGPGAEPVFSFRTNGGLLSVNAKNKRFRELLSDLFAVQDYEFSNLGNSDNMIASFSFENKTFDEMLTLLLQQGSSGFSLIGDIYYIFDIQRKDVLNTFVSTVQIPLNYLSAVELPSIMPSGFLSPNTFKIEKNRNMIILSGSLAEIEPVENIIRTLDVPNPTLQYYRFDLHHLKAEELAGVLHPSFGPLSPMLIRNSNSVVMLLSEPRYQQIRDYITLVDRKIPGIPVVLKYINSETLLANLPPSARTEDIIRTPDPTVIFFSGTEQQYEEFMADLDIMDKPVPQIRYQVLVIEHSKSQNDTNSASFGISDAAHSSSVLKNDGVNPLAIIGNLNNLLNIQFDIIAKAGIAFASNLNLHIQKNNTKIMTDTTLTSLSGEKVNFENTKVTRVRASSEIDPDTGNQTTGVIQEFTNGLIIEIEGWVSGNDMVSMNVSATISKDTTATNSSSSLPSSSRKIVNSTIRTQSGVPMIISGLKANEEDLSREGPPGIVEIPGVNDIINKSGTTIETELTIYIVPYVERMLQEEDSMELRFEQLYERFIGF